MARGENCITSERRQLELSYAFENNCSVRFLYFAFDTWSAFHPKTDDALFGKIWGAAYSLNK